MFKVFISLMIITQQGGVTTAFHTLALNREDQCRYLAEKFSTSIQGTGPKGGAYEVRSKAMCINDTPGTGPAGALPPPVAGAPVPALPEDVFHFLMPNQDWR